jgi:hypothetical protein
MKIKIADDILKELNAIVVKEAKRVEKETVKTLSYLGEECVNEARDRSAEDSWYDQSGNLRSSVGYAVAKDGQAVKLSDFKQVKNGSEGVAVGKQTVLELAERQSGFALVVTAGMEYADEVEAMENKCVLASAELLARSKWAEFQTNLLDKLNK